MSVKHKILEEKREHPLVKELEALAVHTGTQQLPKLQVLPPWFADWADATYQSAQTHLSLWAGRLLARHNKAPEIAAKCVLLRAKHEDLQILRAGLKEPAFQKSLAELSQAIEQVPQDLKDALVAVTIPFHIDYSNGFDDLVKQPECLTLLTPTPGSILEIALKRVTHAAGNLDLKCKTNEAKIPVLTLLNDQIDTITKNLSKIPTLSSCDIIEASDRIEVPLLDKTLLQMSMDTQCPPLFRLVQCMALLRAVRQDPLEDFWKSILQTRACDALWNMGMRRLFDLRIGMLDSLIGSTSFPSLKAKHLFQRGNSRAALAPHDSKSLELALKDLDTARKLAESEANWELWADASSAWIRTYLHAKDRILGLPTLETVIERANEALERPLSKIGRAMILHSAAHLHGPGHEKAVEKLEEALNSVDKSEPLYWDIAFELVSNLVFADNPQTANQRGLSLLEDAPGNVGQVVEGMLHLAVGQSFLKLDCLSEARQHFDAALGLLRSHDSQNESEARINLLFIGSRCDEDLYFEQLYFLEESWDQLSLAQKADMAKYKATFLQSKGEFTQVLEALEKGIDSVAGSEHELSLLLEKASLMLAKTGEAKGLEHILDGCLNASFFQLLQDQVFGLAWYHGDQLSPELLWRIAKRAEEFDRQEIKARVLIRLGKSRSAKQCLRDVVEKPQSLEYEVSCISLLITILDEEEKVEALRLCSRLQKILSKDRWADKHHDLSAALWKFGRDQRETLRSAWRHSQIALKGLEGDALSTAHNVAALILRDLLRPGCELTPQTANLASWLLEDHPVSVQILTAQRLEVSHNLILAGPLCHESILTVAEQLASMASKEENCKSEAEETLDRCSWVRSRLDGRKVSVIRGNNFPRGPFDDAPDWFVSLVAGEPLVHATPCIDEVRTILEWLPKLRPDTLDHVYSQLISAFNPKSEDFQLLSKLLYSAIESQGSQSWPLVSACLEQNPLKGESKLFPVRMALQRCSGAVNSTDWENLELTEPSLLYEVGQSFLTRARQTQDPEKQFKDLEIARAYLSDAESLAKQQDDDIRISILISLGNAWKLGPNCKLDKALEAYASAEGLIQNESQKAQLYKVWADALVQRRSHGDITRALELLEVSLSIRQGWLKAETLWSQAQALLARRVISKEDRTVDATKSLIESIRVDRRHSEQVLPYLLELLEDWKRYRPDDLKAKDITEELLTLYPERKDEIKRAHGSIPEQIVQLEMSLFTDLHYASYVSASQRLSEPDFSVEEILETFDILTRGIARNVGLDLVRFKLQAKQALRNKLPKQKLRELSDMLLEDIKRDSTELVRARFLKELGLIWCPENTEHPLAEYDYALEFAKEAFILEGREDGALPDTLLFLGRTLLQTSDNNSEGNVDSACNCFDLCHDKALEWGMRDLVAQAMYQRAVAEFYKPDGAEFFKLSRGQEVLESAIQYASTDALERKLTAIRNCWLARLATLLPEGEGHSKILEALALFEELELSKLEGHIVEEVRLTWSLCRATLIKRSDCESAELDFWRQNLDSIDRKQEPKRFLNSLCHLVRAILESDPLSEEDLREGHRMAESALQHELLYYYPKKRWEILQLLGMAYSNRGKPNSKKSSDTAISWLQQALQQAKKMGPSSEMVRSALALCEFALTLEDTEQLLTLTENAWESIRKLTPYLLFDKELSESESLTAGRISAQLSKRFSTNCSTIDGEEATKILKWVSRSQSPRRRYSKAYLQRPNLVPRNIWLNWQDALRQRDFQALMETYGAIAEHAPSFLQKESDLSSLKSWLQQNPCSVAVTTISMDQGFRLLVAKNSKGRLEISIAVLRNPLPHDSKDLEELIAKAILGDQASLAKSRKLRDWCKANIAPPLIEQSGSRPECILWCPESDFRLIPPSILWPGIATVCTTSFDLPDHRSAPQRHRSTLTVYADPDRIIDSASSLGELGLKSLRQLSEVALRRGKIRTLQSVGRRSGLSVSGDLHIKNGTASSRNVLRELPEHDTLVVIAHGDFGDPDNAALLLVDEDGAIDRLDVKTIAEHQHRLLGVSVLLLSCEMGRLGTKFADPGGFAGMLLLAGARMVIAPMWPVRLDLATQVGCAVLKELATSGRPWDVLANLESKDNPNGPLMGPPKSRADLKEQSGLQLSSFVTWIG